MFKSYFSNMIRHLWRLETYRSKKIVVANSGFYPNTCSLFYSDRAQNQQGSTSSRKTTHSVNISWKFIQPFFLYRGNKNSLAIERSQFFFARVVLKTLKYTIIHVTKFLYSWGIHQCSTFHFWVDWEDYLSSDLGWIWQHCIFCFYTISPLYDHKLLQLSPKVWNVPWMCYLVVINYNSSCIQYRLHYCLF